MALVENQLIINAKTKRLLLAEVYVHKRPKLTTTSDSIDSFEVFHIFEIDDGESKIIPKLSTNCSEPGKIIEVLKNFTGSDTPQLKRLIDKLCVQSKSKDIDVLAILFKLIVFYSEQMKNGLRIEKYRNEFVRKMDWIIKVTVTLKPLERAILFESSQIKARFLHEKPFRQISKWITATMKPTQRVSIFIPSRLKVWYPHARPFRQLPRMNRPILL